MAKAKTGIGLAGRGINKNSVRTVGIQYNWVVDPFQASVKSVRQLEGQIYRGVGEGGGRCDMIQWWSEIVRSKKAQSS